MAGTGLRRLQRARRHEGLAQARRVRRHRLAVRRARRRFERSARRRRQKAAAGRVLPRQSPRPGGHARGDRRSGHPLRHGHRTQRLGEGRRRRDDSAGDHTTGRPCLRHRRLRHARFLDPEFLGTRLGPARLCPHQLRRLAVQRHRRVGGAPGRSGGTAQAGFDCGAAIGALQPGHRLRLRRPAPARDQRRQRRLAQPRRHLRHQRERRAPPVRAGHSALG